MKKSIGLFAALLLFAGCSNDNKISLYNYSNGEIYFNFLARIDSIDPGQSIPIMNIPNGTYSYATTAEIPPSLHVTSLAWDGGAASGNLTFTSQNTQILLIYSSTYIDSVYTIGATMSSTNSNASVSPTGN